MANGGRGGAFQEEETAKAKAQRRRGQRATGIGSRIGILRTREVIRCHQKPQLRGGTWGFLFRRFTGCCGENRPCEAGSLLSGSDRSGDKTESWEYFQTLSGLARAKDGMEEAGHGWS